MRNIPIHLKMQWVTQICFALMLCTTALFLPGVAKRALAADIGIAGTVTDDSSQPIEMIKVTIYHLQPLPPYDYVWMPLTKTVTSSDGTYQFSLAEGTYRVGFGDDAVPRRFAPEYYPDANSIFFAQDIYVSASSDPGIQTIDAQLSLGGNITGKVTDISGNPISDVVVHAYRPFDEGAGNVTWQILGDTDVQPDGVYTLTLAYSGIVHVGFMNPNGNMDMRYRPEYYDDVKVELPIIEDKTPLGTDITMTVGITVENIDAQLDRFGVITGTITDKSGLPIRDVFVNAYHLLPTDSEEQGWFAIEGAKTDLNGIYELHIWQSKTVHVCLQTQDFVPVYLPQCYGTNNGVPANGTDIEIDYNQTVSNVDMQVSLLGRVKGRVTNESGEPVESSFVSARTFVTNEEGIRVWGENRFDLSDSNGNYEILGVPLGTFIVAADTPSSREYVGEIYENVYDSSLATVLSSEVDSIYTIDFQLVRRGNITGTVRNQIGEPISGVAVTIYSYFEMIPGQLGWHPGQTVFTENDGSYIFPLLYPGTYRIGFGLEQDYSPEFYSSAPSIESATDIVLAPGESASNIDGQLASLYRTIGGRVTDPAGNPLADIVVQLGHNEFGFWIFDGYLATTDLSGTYTLTTLPTGNFSLGFFDNSGKFVTEYYNNASSPISAELFKIPSVAPYSNIDAQMSGKAHLHGMVSGVDGEAIVAHSVIVYDSEANEIARTETITDGSYEFSLLGGEYRLCVGTATVATIYEAECYADASPNDIGAATAISFENGTDIVIDLQLAKKANPNGIINISLSSTPKSIRNLHFHSTVGDFILDDPSGDDVDFFTNVISFVLPSAVYTFSLDLPSDRFVQVINCEGVGSWIVAGSDFQIALPAESTIICKVQLTLGAATRTFSYHDANGDGMFNEGESPLAGITVTVHNITNAIDLEAVSNENGLTEFVNLPPKHSFFICQSPPIDWVNSQPGFLDGQFGSPCYSGMLQASQLATIHFGNMEASDPDFQNVPSTSPDGCVITEMPLVNDTNEEGEVQTNLYLPLVSR